MWSAALLLMALAQTPPPFLAAPAPPSSDAPAVSDAESVFQKYAGRVVQVRVTSEGSGAKAVIGTGFFVTADGKVITNYHVVAPMVFHPERFRCKVLEGSGRETEVQILGLDVVHDLALLATRLPTSSFFNLTELELSQGARVFSLGNPHDVGLSIVEGTYNGRLAETLYERIHFTGSLNPGMSGGPALDKSGHVVGVNVASMGNQLSFLVPVRFAHELLQKAKSQGAQAVLPPEQRKRNVQDELLAAQQSLTQELLSRAPPAKKLGQWSVPGHWLKELKEWGSQVSDDDEPWIVNSYSVSSDDAIYVESNRYAGAFWLKFTHVQGKGISPFRLYYRWGRIFARGDVNEYAFDATRDMATNWSCRTDFVRGQDGQIQRVAFCMRAYKPFEGLYDVLVRTLSFSQTDAVLMGELGLNGISAENARAVSKRFLESITWAR